MATKYPVYRIFLTSGKASHILAPGTSNKGDSSALCGIWSDKWLGEDKQDAIEAEARPMCVNCMHIVTSRGYTLVEPLTREPLTREQILQTPVESVVEDRDGARWRRRPYGWKNENGYGSITSIDLSQGHSPIFLVETAPKKVVEEPAEEQVETLPDIPPAPVEDEAAEKSLLEEEIDRQLLLLRADLVRMRILSGLSRKEVAARVGIARPSTIRKFEEGQKDVHLSFLRRYCLAIGVVLRWDVMVASDDDRAER